MTKFGKFYKKQFHLHNHSCQKASENSNTPTNLSVWRNKWFLGVFNQYIESREHCCSSCSCYYVRISPSQPSQHCCQKLLLSSSLQKETLMHCFFKLSSLIKNALQMMTLKQILMWQTLSKSWWLNFGTQIRRKNVDIKKGSLKCEHCVREW